MTNAVTVSAPPSGRVGRPLAITGTVSPSGDTVQLQLAAHNTALPTGSWVPATTGVSGAFSGALTPAYEGTWYVWAYDPVTGAQGVSKSICVGGGRGRGEVDLVEVPIVEFRESIVVAFSDAPIANAPISNPSVLTTSYTIPDGHNAVSIGPFTVAPGAVLTVPPGSTWRVL